MTCNWSTTLAGESPDYLKIRDWALASGAMFTDRDVRTAAKMAVLGSKTANELFLDGLTRALPTWKQVQATDECQAWLASRIPGSRATWNDSLLDAANRHDVDAVMEVFAADFT